MQQEYIYICYDRWLHGTRRIPLVQWAAAVALLEREADVSGWSVEIDDEAWVVTFSRGA